MRYLFVLRQHYFFVKVWEKGNFKNENFFHSLLKLVPDLYNFATVWLPGDKKPMLHANFRSKLYGIQLNQLYLIQVIEFWLEVKQVKLFLCIQNLKIGLATLKRCLFICNNITPCWSVLDFWKIKQVWKIKFNELDF